MSELKGHQGDVQFRQVASIPEDAKKIARRPIALGEQSGHQHVLTGDFELYEKENTVFAKVGKKGAVLQHVHENHVSTLALDSTELLPQADHGPAVFPPDTVIELWIQNQYNPYSQLMEKSLD